MEAYHNHKYMLVCTSPSGRQFAYFYDDIDTCYNCSHHMNTLHWNTELYTVGIDDKHQTFAYVLTDFEEQGATLARIRKESRINKKEE